MEAMISAMLRFQVECLYQYLSLTKQMLDIYVPYQPRVVDVTPAFSQKVVNLPSRGCIGPADLRG